MKTRTTRTLLLALAAAALAVLIAADDADAKRLGGGRSLGAQRQSVAPPAATTPGPAANPVMPAQPGSSFAKPATPAAPAAPAATGASRWLGPIAGIAAGLGLAALLSHFGLSEEFAGVLLLGLAVLAIVFVVRLLLARRSAAAPAYAGATAAGRGTPGDTAFRRVEPVLTPPPAAATSFAKPVPDGFDAGAFEREAKIQYRRLQAAWDAGDRKALAGVMTPEMAAEAARDLASRGAHEATEVVSLDADVLEVSTEGGAHWASVRFTGLVREDGAPQPSPVDEVWNLTKPVDGSTGWLLAGIRQVA